MSTAQQGAAAEETRHHVLTSMLLSNSGAIQIIHRDKLAEWLKVESSSLDAASCCALAQLAHSKLERAPELWADWDVTYNEQLDSFVAISRARARELADLSTHPVP